MAEEVVLTIGDLYAEVHGQMCDSIGEQYEAELRQELEDFIHNYNQRVERQLEQQQAAQQELDDVPEEELEAAAE